MFTSKHGQMTLEHYSNIQDFLRTQESREYTNNAQTRRRYDDPSFTGVDSYDEALDLLVHGFSKPVKALNVKASDAGYTMRPSIIPCYAGGTVNIAKALTGNPLCFSRRKNVPHKTPIVKLLIDVGRPASVTAKDVEMFGQKLVGLIKGLEQSGRRVQIDIFATVASDFDRPFKGFTLNVKKAEEVLDIKRIAFPLMHVAFQRVFKFDWYDRVPDAAFVSGYGHALYIEQRRNPSVANKLIKTITEGGYTYVNIESDIDELIKTI